MMYEDFERHDPYGDLIDDYTSFMAYERDELEYDAWLIEQEEMEDD